MSDYESCPTCHGRGLIPVEQAEAIEEHLATVYELAHRRQQEEIRATLQAAGALQAADANKWIADLDAAITALLGRAT